MGKKIKVELLEYFKLLGIYFRKRKKFFFLTGILLLTDIAFQLLNPQIMKYFVDSALSGKAANCADSYSLSACGYHFNVYNA
jgi:ATP-binding cassette, subfamily B, bacterial